VSDNEILERAIRKAIDNGWWPFRPLDRRFKEGGNNQAWFSRFYTVDAFGIRSKDKDWDYDCLECYAPAYPLNEFIFNHDFAKALWGDETKYTRLEAKDIGIKLSSDSIYAIKKLGWKHHLMQMVVADYPIEYLKNHMEDTK